MFEFFTDREEHVLGERTVVDDLLRSNDRVKGDDQVIAVLAVGYDTVKAIYGN